MAKKKTKNENPKFYNFVNVSDNETDFYLYGEIVSSSDWKWSEDDVAFQDIKNTIDNMGDSSTLNIRVNSPGGSVFASSAIVTLLKDTKRRGVKINSYLDSLCASCASWIPLCADNVYIYENSIMMLHKPMTSCFGANADDLREEIDLLDKIQKNVMLPTYMNKAKEGITEDDINELVDKTSWLTSDEIQQYFDVTLLDDKENEHYSNVKHSYITNVIDNYGDIPENIKEILEREEDNMKDENSKSVLDLFDDENKDTVNSTEPLNQEDSGDVSEPSEPKDDKDNKDDDKKDDKDNKDKEEKDGEEKDNEPSEPKDNKEDLSNEVKELKNIIANLMPIVDEYKKNKENEALNNLLNSYKDRFNKYGLSDLFESDEVQDLIKDGVSNDKSLLKLDSILLDNISLNNKETKRIVKEKANDVDNLLDTKNTAKSFGFED